MAKGAPQSILELIGPRETAASEIEQKVLSFAEKGYRALGVAHTDPAGAWRYAGLIPLYDPPREDSAETIRTAQSMGIEVKMITGDHRAIAQETAKLVGLKTNILPAGTFIKEPSETPTKSWRKQTASPRFFRSTSTISSSFSKAGTTSWA